MTTGSTSTQIESTNAYYGVTVPSTIDAAILNDNNDLFLFSNYEVTRIENSKSTFRINNNGNANYYKATNHNGRPATVTAGTKVDSSTHYIFNADQIITFTEGSRKGTWNTIGRILCD